MKYHEVTAVAAEARTLTEDEFVRRHPDPCLIVEPFDAEGAAALATTTANPTGAEAKRTVLHPNARLAWITLFFVDGERRWPTLNFGRDPACDVPLPHKSISKKHATLRRMGDAFIVTDLQSTNGTKVNEQPVAPGSTAKLGPEDVLVLGEVVVLRIVTTPEKLYWLLHASHQQLAPRVPATTRLVNLEGLIEEFRAFGLDAKHEHRQIDIASPDGRTHVRVAIEEEVYAVEWGRDGALTNRRAIAISEPRAHESLKVLVLEAMSGGKHGTA